MLSQSPSYSSKQLAEDASVPKSHPPPLEHTDSGASSAPTPRGFRAQLYHLLPRHALFHANIKIHQISSVPLVRGDFAVRWKFKNWVAPPHSKSGLFKLSRGSSSANNSLVDLDSHRKLESEHEHDHDADSISSSVSPDGSSSMTSSSEDPSIPVVVVSEDGAPIHSSHHTPARGQTVFLPLKEHAVTWSHSLSVHLKIPLSRDRENPDGLTPCPVKFVVTQRVVAGDPDAPKNPRLGAVYLDLSEYAGPEVGGVTRTYLLRDSKTNTTLKLTIQLTHVGGETHFVAPPLPKGEILNGLNGLLENDMYRTRPRGFDVYGRYIDERDGDESDDSDSQAHLPSSSSSSRRPSMYQIPTLTAEHPVPFDVSRLPLTDAYGPKTTETLIEALFNPVPVSSALRAEGKSNPFVRYVADPDALA